MFACVMMLTINNHLPWARRKHCNCPLCPATKHNINQYVSNTWLHPWS